MPWTANPAPGAWLMYAMESVSFGIYIPIRQMVGESSNLYLYYCGPESGGSAFVDSYALKHAANGDLQGRLTVSIKPQVGSEPSRYVWQLDENTGDALWVREILTELATVWRSELKEFLARCCRDAMSDPAKPFRAVFTSSAKPHETERTFPVT